MRWLVALGVAAVVVVAPAGPVAADAARPGNVRSEVLSVEPTLPGVVVEVEGGDAFLVLRVPEGSTAAVAGYQGEPYLRVLADGTVEENQASEAVYLNRDRRPVAAVPEGVGPDEPPRWQRVGGGGSVAWHDHRIHWMGTGDPVAEVTPWEVPLVVDGQPVVVRGQYVRLDAPAPWPWWAVAVVVAVAVGVLGWSRQRVAAVAVVVAATVGLPVAWTLATGYGTSASSWSGVVLLVVALAAGVAAALRRGWWSGGVLAGGGVALLVWSGRRVEALTSAVLVSDVPAWWDRGATALALGAGVAAVVVGVRAVLAPAPMRVTDASLA